MNKFKWNFLIISIIYIQLSIAFPTTRVKRQDDAVQFTLDTQELNPINLEDSSANLEREKRKLPDGKFEGKNAILGFVFGENENIKNHRNRRAAKDATKDDAAELDRNNVMLDIPDQLFSQSFTTVTNVSKILANFISNSARRYAKVMFFFKPLFGNTLTIEGHDYVPTTTTTKKP